MRMWWRRYSADPLLIRRLWALVCFWVPRLNLPFPIWTPDDVFSDQIWPVTLCPGSVKPQNQPPSLPARCPGQNGIRSLQGYSRVPRMINPWQSIVHQEIVVAACPNKACSRFLRIVIRSFVRFSHSAFSTAKSRATMYLHLAQYCRLRGLLRIKFLLAHFFCGIWILVVGRARRAASEPI